MGALFSRLMSAFFSKKLELVLLGLENAGKTTLLHVLADGRPIETCPTIGLNVRVVEKEGGLTMKCWDIGGQQQYRSEWSRYSRGCDVIVYLVDASDMDRLSEAKYELHRLLEDSELAKTPLLILANKIDIEPHVEEAELIRELNLDYITEQPWIIFPISALKQINVELAIQWLLKQSK